MINVVTMHWREMLPGHSILLKNNIYFRVFTAFNSNRLLKTLIIPLKLNKNFKKNIDLNYFKN